MIKGGDLFGDGVNIAARLQTLASAGGVCLSASPTIRSEKFSLLRSLTLAYNKSRTSRNRFEPLP